MKKIAVLGSGFVSKPAVDYFLDRCGYEVVVTSLNKSEAEKIIEERPGGRAVAWSQEQHDLLDNMRTKQLIDEVKSQDGKVKSITSYGAGLPSFEDNSNPLGYTFVNKTLECQLPDSGTPQL